MAKKRSCRRTLDENKIHDKAVKMRKMTDVQLVHYVEDRVNKARSEGFNEGRKDYENAYNRGFGEGVQRQKTLASRQHPGVKEFLQELRENGIKGIGAVTISKLERVAAENGYT
jgi:hypothetical protein